MRTSNPNELTDRQKRVYEVIRDKIVTRGYGPTVREIGEILDISSPNGVMCHLRALERKGKILRLANKSRAIELTEGIPRHQSNATLPLLGDVGDARCNLKEQPLTTTLDAVATASSRTKDDQIDLAEMFVRDDRFVLRVQDDSLIDAHINRGDYVLIQRQSFAFPGQIVVADTEDEHSVLKYWYPEKDQIRLQPANKQLPVTTVTTAKVHGVVVGVLRAIN